MSVIFKGLGLLMGDIAATDVNKIDAEAVNGLMGTVDSLSYKVHEIEKHLHNWERWLGLAAVPVGETHRFDIDSMTPFQMQPLNSVTIFFMSCIDKSCLGYFSKNLLISLPLRGFTVFSLCRGAAKSGALKFILMSLLQYTKK